MNISCVHRDIPQDLTPSELDLHGRYPQQGRRWGSP
jgi:hypothetical protein